MARKKIKNILVVIPTGDYAERLKLDGVLKYARDKVGARWNLKLCLDSHFRFPPLETCRLKFDGIIAYVQSTTERHKLLQTGKPTVLIEDQFDPVNPTRCKGVASIICDHVAEGRTAATYFLARHFTNFAFIGVSGKVMWSELRRRGFEAELRKHGLMCAVFSEKTKLGVWLKSLPKPCAIFAARDMRAREVIDAAEEFGIAVPQEIAVLGVDNDEILCTTARPGISSIPSFDHALGYAAGRMLNALMTGRSSGGEIRTRHANVVSRQSTETDVIDDPFVKKAITYIRLHLDDDLSARRIAASIGYSASALKEHFAHTLGTTVSETVRRLRLAGARELLTGTSLPIEEIALRCGFSCTSHLCLRMREAEGITPLVYRRQHSDLSQKPSQGTSKINLRNSGMKFLEP